MQTRTNQDALPDFCHFVRGLDCVKSLHFLIRDRINDEVAFSFRVLVDPKQKRLVKSKTTYKLGTLFSSDKFAVEPASGISAGICRVGVEKEGCRPWVEEVDNFTNFLCSMSKLVVEIVEK